MSEKRFLSRSELVRQRRRARIQHQPRPPKKTFGNGTSREGPPIAMRGVVNEAAFERYIQTNRRRFHTAYSLPMPAARLASLGRIHPGVRSRLLSFLLLLVVFAGLYAFWSLSEFRVAAAQVAGNQRLATEEVDAMLGTNGIPIFLVDPSQVEFRLLRDYPELAAVNVSVRLPNRVNVEVTERVPVIQWQQDGNYTWIDETGIAFRPHGHVQGLIQINAVSAPPSLAADPNETVPLQRFVAGDTVKALRSLAAHVPPGTSLEYSPEFGFSWIDPRGWLVAFGHEPDETHVKLRVYQALVDWLTQRGLTPVLINVTYPQTPYYRLDIGHAEE